jgi:hypothetical protein
MNLSIASPAALPRFARISVLAGLLWSLSGVWQFVQQTFADTAARMAAGMSAVQAQLQVGLPMSMHAVFAIGTIGGAIGCVLLLG